MTNSSGYSYACIRTHHLLDHKPDNLLRTGHKYQLTGFYKFGTPGIAVVFGQDDAVGMENFLDTLKSNMPQKKFEMVFQRSFLGDNIPNQWQEISTASILQEELSKLGLPEDDYYTILGVPNKKTEGDTNDQKKNGKKGGSSNNNKSGGKAGKKKK